MDSSKGAKTRLVDSARFINPKLWTLQGASAPDLWTKRCAKAGLASEKAVKSMRRKEVGQMQIKEFTEEEQEILRSNPSSILINIVQNRRPVQI